MKDRGGKAGSPKSRERLLDAAMALFAAKGYASTSVREIVSLAGVSKPVLYYYFENKEGLFRAILDWAVELQEAMLADVLQNHGTVLERLYYLYQRVYQGVLENQNLFRMIHNLLFGPPQGAPPYDYESYHRRMAGAIKGIYDEGIALREVRETDLDDVATLVLSLVDFCFLMGHIHPEFLNPQRPQNLLQLAFMGLAQRGADR
jgi:AcrR family transcriptional regulator